MLDLLRYFMTPDDHGGDPAGFVATQAGHFGAIGAPACWVALTLGSPPWAAIAIVATLYACVELAQARFGQQTLRDAATDWAFVMAGAIFLLGVDAAAPIVSAVSLAAAAAGLIRGAAARR